MPTRNAYFQVPSDFSFHQAYISDEKTFQI